MAEIRKFFLIPDRKIKPQQQFDWYFRQAQIFYDLFALCQNTQQLPRPGGLLAQDSLYVDLMRHAFNCQEERRALDEAKRRMDSHA